MAFNQPLKYDRTTLNKCTRGTCPMLSFGGPGIVIAKPNAIPILQPRQDGAVWEAGLVASHPHEPFFPWGRYAL